MSRRGTLLPTHLCSSARLGLTFAVAIGVLIGAKDYWGKGLAGESVAAVAELGFSDFGLERFEAGFYADNVASQHAFKRAGFVEEGRLIAARRIGDTRTDEIVMARLRAGARPDKDEP